MTRPGLACLVAALLAVLLGACSSVPRSRDGQALTPAGLESFQLSGSISLRVAKESFPGRVRWSHTPGRDELWFYSPVGSAVAHLLQDEDGALLVNEKGEEYRAADLQSLTAEVLGWDLPLAGLPYWVRGLPWPAADATAAQRDPRGRLMRLEQAGWKVVYLTWFGNAADALPAKLDLQGERLRLRLAVQSWDLPDAP